MSDFALKSWLDVTAASEEINMRVLKMYCKECNGPAVIKKTNWLTKEIADLYCACADVECGHTFVSQLTYARELSPSAKTGDKLINMLISQLRPEQKQYALELLSAE